MVERLSEEERALIRKHWNSIKEKVLNKSDSEITDRNFTIKIKATYKKILLSIKDGQIRWRAVNIYKNARFIKFKKNLVEKEELIYQPSSILFFLQLNKMKHPIYRKKDQEKTLDISVKEENCNEIFNNPDITEIIDIDLDKIYSKEQFFQFQNKIIDEPNDYYDEFSLKEYSQFADIITNNSKKILESKGREDLISFIENLFLIKEKIIILAGSQKIGISFSLLQTVKFYNILYIDLNIISSLKNDDKRKYIMQRCFNLFNDYNKYEKFITEKILPLTDYNDILSIIIEILNLFGTITSNSEVEEEGLDIEMKMPQKIENFIAIIDNYDDHLVGMTKLTSYYIDKLYYIIFEKNMKCIFIGRGLFISNLLVLYFFNKPQIKNFILFKYYSTLGLNIENIIHSFYKEKKENEIDLYFRKKYVNNIEYSIYNILIMKNIKNIIGENFQEEIPFHFFLFSFDRNNNLKIEYQFQDLIDISNSKLRGYLAELNNLTLFSDRIIPSIQGFLLEELVITLFLNNKTSFKNLRFEKDNIIEIDSIFEMEDNVVKITNLKDGPILIVQKVNGELFDFGIIINSNNINYFVVGQIGINKNLSDLADYTDLIAQNKKQIIKNLEILTNRKINEFRLIIILSKETQESLLEEYKTLNENKKSNDIKNKNDKKDKEDEKNKIKEGLTKSDLYMIKEKRKLEHYNGEFAYKTRDLSYLLFSSVDFCFYKDNKKIEFFDVNDYHYFKIGFDSLCSKEYNLNDFTVKEPLLNQKEKQLLLNKLKEIDSDIQDIKINKKIKGKFSILPRTPSKCAIFSIKGNIKLITYFSDTFNHFLLKENEIYKYEHSNELFDYNYENKEILEKYFLEFMYGDIDEIGLEENDKRDDDNIQKYKESTSKKIKEKKITSNESEEKIGYHENQLQYLQNKKKRNESED